ncbi:MAG TPA: hypothetical protein VKQ30_11210 [Ktedonobacterales bacterium]|nr:hypothetical protein [Ktedonobacterales bacterium]
MRAIQRHPVARALIAAAVSAAVSWVAVHVGAVVVDVLLFTSLFVLAFIVLSIAPDLIALQRKHNWRWWWRSSHDDGPYWPGTRIPRHPRA